MKVKVGNRVTTLAKDVVASHMANLLSTRAIILGNERDFKQSFNKYKELSLAFLKYNRKFIYTFGDDIWLEEFLNFQAKQYELLMQDVMFKFSDGSVWSISLNDIANLKIMHEINSKHDKNKLLEEPIVLVSWAQEYLTWDQLKNYATLRNIDPEEATYNKEWSTVNKKIIRWQYNSEK